MLLVTSLFSVTRSFPERSCPAQPWLCSQLAPRAAATLPCHRPSSLAGPKDVFVTWQVLWKTGKSSPAKLRSEVFLPWTDLKAQTPNPSANGLHVVSVFYLFIVPSRSVYNTGRLLRKLQATGKEGFRAAFPWVCFQEWGRAGLSDISRR